MVAQSIGSIQSTFLRVIYYYIRIMIFQWDPIKAASNVEKHGISFEELLQFLEIR